jgi:hypothetical protein
MQHWSKLDIHEGEPGPVGRDDHAAVCLGYGGDRPQLLVVGGRGGGNKVLNDLWILDVQARTWKEVRLSMWDRIGCITLIWTPRNETIHVLKLCPC